MKLKLIKRILCLTLAVLMVLAIVACGPDDDKKGGNNDDGTTESTTSSTDNGDGPDDGSASTEPANNEDELPEADFGGAELSLFAMVQAGSNESSFDAKYDGDVVHNAVYQRNKDISERFNVKLNIIDQACDTNNDGEGSMYQIMDSLKETPTYHIVTTGSHKMTRLASKGLLHDLNSSNITYVDLNKDYYDDGYNAAYNVGGRQYLVSGKLTISWYRYQIVTFFNRNMFLENNVDYLYDTVLNGEWTLAKMAEVASNFYKDDGDNIYNQADTFGYYLFCGDQASQTDGFMGAFNLRVVEKDENGYYEAIEIDPTPWTEAMTEFLDMLNSQACWGGRQASGGGNPDGTTDNNNTVDKKFTDEKAAMMTYRMYIVEKDAMVQLGRTLEGYGIVPLPMANDEQDDYISYVQDQVLCLGIPYTMVNDDYVLAQYFLEAFASHSYNTTVPAYYERALTKKYVTDEPSYEMIKIIDSNIIVDPVNAQLGYGFGFNTTALRPVFGGQTNIVTVLQEKLIGLDSAFATKVAQFNEEFRVLDEKLTADGYANSGNIITEADHKD